jgi:predicted phage terminase large subunit-like protein
MTGFKEGNIGGIESFQKLIPLLNKKENRLYAAKQSFESFIYIYLSHHLSIAPALFQIEQYGLAKEKRLLLLNPRGYGKSVIWSMCYPLWVILNNPYGLDLKWNKEEIVCLSNTARFAERFLKQIERELLQNPRIRADYEIKQGDVWRSDQIDLSGMGSIIALGAGAQVRGYHPTEVLIDDLEDREECKSETNRDKMNEYFFKDLYGVLRDEAEKSTRMKIIGTTVHPLCLLLELYHDEHWVKRRYPIMDGMGRPLWPEYEDEEKLVLKRKLVREDSWWSEYMLAPRVSENPTFERSWFRPYEPGMIRSSDGRKIGLRDMYIVTAMDPAISQREAGDYTAMVTIGATWDAKDPHIYVLDARRGHWTLSKQITELMAAQEKYPGSVQLIETIAYQKALYLEYRRRLDQERMNVRVLEIEPDKDKGRRANAVTPMFQRGQVYFDFQDPMQHLLMDELVLFDYEKRKSGRDDFVDAIVHAVTYIQDWMHRRKKSDENSGELKVMFTPQGRNYARAI